MNDDLAPRSPRTITMPDRIGVVVGLSFIVLGVLLFGGFLERDTTQTVWIVIGGLLFGLGIVVISLVTRNWLYWRRELRDYRTPE
jgi:hypothetical protein